MTSEPVVRTGVVEPALSAELPGLGIAFCLLAISGDPLRRSPPELRRCARPVRTDEAGRASRHACSIDITTMVWFSSW